MTRRLARSLMLVVAVVGLCAASARAQETPAGEETESAGSGPVPGYVAAGLLGGAAIFVLCKSARR